MAVSIKTLESIKRASLSTVIESTGAKLKKVGREFVTTCIWHDDSNPSLTINDEKGFCYCHACRKGGDHIDYLQQRFNIDFPSAAEKAAGILGIVFELEDEDPEAARRAREAKKKAIDALEEEQKIYFENLQDPRNVRIKNILESRGISQEAVDEFKIGYSKSGFFEKRITIPIYNRKEELVGFTARATVPDQKPKYKNSAASDLFDKSSLVFNETRAREAARESDSLIFVEGHMDVISMWQVGIRNAVALQGTGAPSVNLLTQLTKGITNVILCFDGDQGGSIATERFLATAGPMSLKGMFNVQIVELPVGMDPDEVIREHGEHGGNVFYNYIASALPWLDWVINNFGQSDRTDTAAMAAIEKKLREYVSQMTSEAVKSHYIKKISLLLAPDEKSASAVEKEFDKISIFSQENTYSPPDVLRMRHASERRLLRLYIHHPHARARLENLLGQVTSPPLQWLVKKIEELENYLEDPFTADDVLMALIVSQKHYSTQLRSLAEPTIKEIASDEMIAHLIRVLETDTADLAKVVE